MIKEIIMHLWQQISIIYISLYVCMRFSCLHVYVCTMSVIGANGIHNRKSDPLELEVQMVMNHHVVLRLNLKSFARAEYLYIQACVCIHMHTEISLSIFAICVYVISGLTSLCRITNYWSIIPRKGFYSISWQSSCL